MNRDAAVAAVSRTILGVLREACPAPLLARSRFLVVTPRQLARPPAQGFTLLLTHVQPDATARNALQRRGVDGPVLGLRYVLSAWAAKAETQQTLLAAAVRGLHATPILTAALLARLGGEPQLFGDDETLQVVLDGMAPREAWPTADDLPPSLRLSVNAVRLGD